MDIPKEISENDYVERYLFCCGTCKYKKKGRCKLADSECYSEIVDDCCSCDEWFPMKGLEVE